MIIGLVALMGIIFGVGSQDYFYLHNFDKSINKYVDDKERKKELQSYIKDYQKAVKEYNKKHEEQIELFKEKNLDKNISIQWYEDFFGSVLELRKDRQANAIDFRLLVQRIITDDEWENIIADTKKEESKTLEKEKKKTDKKKGSNDQQFLGKDDQYVSDEERQEEIMQSFQKFADASLELRASYHEFNAVSNQLLVDKEASEEEMWEVVNSSNDMRVEMYTEFLGFLENLKKNTNMDEWAIIMKDFNKELSVLKY